METATTPHGKRQIGWQVHWPPAPEVRQTLAPGVSPGWVLARSQAPEGRQTHPVLGRECVQALPWFQTRGEQTP